jgi:hypothetical protein
VNDWELVDDGSWNGLRKWMRSTDDDHGTVQVAYDQVNLKAALDANKHAQNHEQIDRKSEMWHVGSIPPIVILKWRTEHGIDIFNPNHAAGVKRLLNSSEWAYLKRAPIVL